MSQHLRVIQNWISLGFMSETDGDRRRIKQELHQLVTNFHALGDQDQRQNVPLQAGQFYDLLGRPLAKKFHVITVLLKWVQEPMAKIIY